MSDGTDIMYDRAPRCRVHYCVHVINSQSKQQNVPLSCGIAPVILPTQFKKVRQLNWGYEYVNILKCGARYADMHIKTSSHLIKSS